MLSRGVIVMGSNSVTVYIQSCLSLID